jgi:hypothetical protein
MKRSRILEGTGLALWRIFMTSKSRRWIAGIFATLCLLGGAAEPCKAQQPDPRQAMVKELAAPGPHASLGDEARVFDRLVGTWDCDYGFYAEDGSVTHTPGELKFGWIIDGRALQDIWISYPRKASTERGIGTSIRFFDTKSKVWRVVFVSPAYGALIMVQGGAEGTRIVLRGLDDQGSALRWSFNDIQADSFIWRGEKSRDGGKTWKLEEEHRMTRRKSVASSPGPSESLDDFRTEMIRALAAKAPHSSLGPHAQLFDRFVGTWDLDCVLCDAKGRTSRFRGEWVFGWVLDGRVIQDVLIVSDKQRRKLGTTIRFFVAKFGQWRVVWIPPFSGNVITLTGGAVGDRIVLSGQDVDGSKLRWSFNKIQTDSFLWRGETSADGGKTWRIEQEMRLKRRVPSAA